MVAPSFQKMEIVTEPYTKNNRSYVDVKNPNTGTVRSVRWYSSAEYASSYGPKLNSSISSTTLKTIRGFSQGPILVIRNAKPSDEEYLNCSNARFAVDVGWYIVSTENPPKDLPRHIHLVPLDWEEYRNKTAAQIEKTLHLKEKT